MPCITVALIQRVLLAGPQETGWRQGGGGTTYTQLTQLTPKKLLCIILDNAVSIGIAFCHWQLCIAEAESSLDLEGQEGAVSTITHWEKVVNLMYDT